MAGARSSSSRTPPSGRRSRAASSALWKQRLRWARGNVQVTRRVQASAVVPAAPDHRLGSISFGLLWFCLLLLPVFMVLASASLVTLFFIDFPLAWTAFHFLWMTNAITYIFITSYSLAIDPPDGTACLAEAMMFPGAVNLIIIVYVCFPRLFGDAWHALSGPAHGTSGRGASWLILFAYAWLGLSMAAAYLAKVVEPKKYGKFFSALLVYVVGYGIATVRLHLRILRKGTAKGRDEMGQDREDGESGIADEDVTPGPQQPAFEDEIRDALRYERGLLIMALLHWRWSRPS